MAADKPAPAVAPPSPLPHFYIATERLFIHNPESGVAPAQAFAPGDRVPPDLVDAYGWQAGVRLPDTPPGPAQSSPPRPAPAAATAETASKEQ